MSSVFRPTSRTTAALGFGPAMRDPLVDLLSRRHRADAPPRDAQDLAPDVAAGRRPVAASFNSSSRKPKPLMAARRAGPALRGPAQEKAPALGGRDARAAGAATAMCGPGARRSMDTMSTRRGAHCREPPLSPERGPSGNRSDMEVQGSNLDGTGADAREAAEFEVCPARFPTELWENRPQVWSAGSFGNSTGSKAWTSTELLGEEADPQSRSPRRADPRSGHRARHARHT